MRYDELKDWLNDVRSKNAGSQDVLSIIGSLEATLAKPYNNLTISTVREYLVKLISIDAKTHKVQYPSTALTAGSLYEAFGRPRSNTEFMQSYPKIAEKQPVVLHEVAHTVPTRVEKNAVALLDVDHTLLFEDKLNHNLLDALKNKGIRDVYLFTDMYFDERQIANRKELIENLKQEGFRVHGVITPSDYTWNVKDRLDILSGKFVERNIDIPRGRNVDKIDELFRELPVLNDYIEGQPELPGLGVAYQEVSRRDAYQRNDAEQSINCKLAIDLISLKRGTASPKTLMFEHFLKKKPEWVDEVFVFDDKMENLAAVKETLKEDHHEIPVSTYYVTENTSTADFEFEIDIHRNTKNKDPLNESVRSNIVDTLDKYIKSRSSCWFLFFHNEGLTNEKVKNARMLMDFLNDENSIKTLGDAKKLMHDMISLNKTTESGFKKTYLSGAGKFDTLIHEFDSWLESNETNSQFSF